MDAITLGARIDERTGVALEWNNNKEVITIGIAYNIEEIEELNLKLKNSTKKYICVVCGELKDDKRCACDNDI